MSSPVALMGAAGVMLAGAAFFLTDPTPSPTPEATLALAPVQVEPQVTLEPRQVDPPLRREDIYVSVYNNSNITGLAGRTASLIGGSGWQVVGSDNWYGTIPATTIYYPEDLREAAELLSGDLGIERLMPAVDPMLQDRLTVILTADYA